MRTSIFVISLFCMLAGAPPVRAQRETVSTRTAYVRDRQMRIVGTLRHGEHFQIRRPARGGYAYGSAFGQTNARGYINRRYLRP